MLYVAVSTPAGTTRAAITLTEVDGAVWQLRIVILIATMIGLAIAAIVSAFASHLMARPLQELVGRARELGHPAGDSLGEIPVLAGSLERLAVQLDRAVGDLARERDRFRTILQAMGDPVLVFDPEGRILLNNDAAQEQLGLHTGVEHLREIPLPGLADVLHGIGGDGDRIVAELTSPRGAVFLITATALPDSARTVVLSLIHI